MDSRWAIHTLVFDLDDTLYAEREFVLSGFQAVDAWLNRHKRLPGFAAEAERLFAAGHRGLIFDEVLASLGAAPSRSAVDELVAVYRNHAPTLTMPMEAGEILEWGRRLFRLALISDGFHATQALKVEALGIRPLFSACILTDELGREFWKPHPESFRRVMTQLPGPASGYVYVADNPRKDFIAPRALGWRTVRLRRPDGEHHLYEASVAEAADVEIASLRELPGLIEQVKA